MYDDPTGNTPSAGGGSGGGATALGYIADIGMGFIQNEWNKNAANEQRQWSAAQQEKQNAFNLAQWERANQYNSPREQMARFKQAGLNPNLIYGKGGNAVAASPTKSATAQTQQRKVSPVMQGSALTNIMTVAQIKQMQAQTESINLDNEKRKIDLGSANLTVYTVQKGEMTVVETKVGNRYQYQKDLELQQKQQNLDTGRFNQQVSAMAARLAKFNISLSDKLVIKQLVLNMEGQEISTLDKQALLLAIAALSR